ncbi:MAG: hypothetical protein E8A49_01275 [Phenylobacterium sp.]|nr:MAG: hypothetical protein E8A49_01275 [Phenylobacterium sp.]
MLVVEPSDRSLIANQADAKGALKPADGVFVGVLPKSENIAATATEWSGTRWTELAWPLLPDDASKRHVMLAHEMYHRIQPDLPLGVTSGGDNAHLDTLEGRYLLQLEWRALAKALTAPDAAARRRAIADSLLFRGQRYALFPAAAADERALELNEGVAEYTGVRLGLTTPQARTAYAISDLKPYIPDATFMRSFAYATGPSYGLLLDRADPAWRGKLAPGRGLDQMLAAALRLPPANLAVLTAREAAYDGDGTLRAAEVKRDAAMKARAAADKATLADGPVLVLPLKHANYQFNPQTLRPLGELGTVYSTLRLVDDWGVLEVEGGALMAKDGKSVSVSAAGIDPSGLKGSGWTLTLKPGWAVGPGGRGGDLALTAPRSGHP